MLQNHRREYGLEMRKPKRPSDTNQLAKSVVDLATGEKAGKQRLNPCRKITF